jgi:hypothetical protein
VVKTAADCANSNQCFAGQRHVLENYYDRGRRCLDAAKSNFPAPPAQGTGLQAWDASPPADAPRLVGSSGSAEEHRALGLRSTVLLGEQRSPGASFGASGTPIAVLLDIDGKVASPVARGAPQVLALANGQPLPPMMRGGGSWPAGPKIGEQAPPVELNDLDGTTVRLADFRGTTTLVLFWRPGCGFCQRMLPDLKA